MLPQKPAPGDRFSASIELENLGTLGAKDVKVTLKGLTVDGIYSELVGVNYLKTIEGGRTGKLNFSLVASNKINVQSFPLEIAVDYKDEFGNSYAESFIYYVPIKQKWMMQKKSLSRWSSFLMQGLRQKTMWTGQKEDTRMQNMIMRTKEQT